MPSYCGPLPARTQARAICQLQHLHQLKKVAESFIIIISLVSTRQLMPVVRPREYELLKTSPTLQNNSRLVNFASACIFQPTDKEPEVILFP